MAHKGLFWVNLLDYGRGDGQRAYRLIFECECTTVVALHEELREFGVVNGTRLRAANDEDGNWIVRERQDFMFGASAVLTIQPYQPSSREIAQ